jgi:hypothetical protein
MKTATIICFFLLILNSPAFNQDSLSYSPDKDYIKKSSLNGFIRGGLYAWRDQFDNKPCVTTAFSDLALKLESGNGQNFRAFADLRFRYGSEFLEPVSKLDIREAYVTLTGKKWNFSTGQEIVKWGRCDFTNPTGKLNPGDMLLRSPDREDRDMANLLSSVNFFPWKSVNLEAVVMPFYRPSKLIIDPVPLPENVTINKISPLLTGKEMYSYGLKVDFYLKRIDCSLSWFDGYDPIPGIALTEFDFDLTKPLPVPGIILSVKPYRIRVLGIDFETTAGLWD